MSEAFLLQGDCLKESSIIPDSSVDLFITDLPYGTTKCKWDVILPFEDIWRTLDRLRKPETAVLFFGTEPFSSQLRISNLPLYRYDWYWEKDKGANWMFGNKMPLKTFEIISVFYEKQPTYNPQKTLNPKGPSTKHLHKNPSKISKNVKDVMGSSWKETEMSEEQNYSGRNYEPDKLLPRQSIYFPREQKGKVHPTQKPVALLKYLIKTYSNENEVVMDLTMGSGSTGVAALSLERHFIGIEKDEEYFKAAEKRIEVLKEKRC